MSNTGSCDRDLHTYVDLIIALFIKRIHDLEIVLLYIMSFHMHYLSIHPHVLYIK